MGPAGSGKSTYCSTIVNFTSRSLAYINLDPANDCEAVVNIQDFITLEDIQTELGFGPNGGLIYALEYFIEQIEWFEEQLGEFENDNIIIDLPGQIELFTHSKVVPTLVRFLIEKGYRVVGVYLLDSQFVQDVDKFFAGVMSCMSCMLSLQIPFISVLSKMDLLGDRGAAEVERFSFFLNFRFLSVDSELLHEASTGSAKFRLLNEALVRLIDEYSMVNFIPLNINEDDSIAYLLSHIDNAIQFGEDDEPKIPKDYDYEDES